MSDIKIEFWRVCPGPGCAQSWTSQESWEENTAEAGTEMREVRGQDRTWFILVTIRKHACGGQTLDHGRVVREEMLRDRRLSA